MTLVKRNGRSNILPSIWDNFFNRDVFNWESNFANTGNSMPAVNIKETPKNSLWKWRRRAWKKKILKLSLMVQPYHQFRKTK